MNTRILSTPDEFAASREAWNHLVRDSTDLHTGLDATSTFEWFETISKTFGRGAKVRVALLEEAGQAVGVLPMLWGRSTLFGQSLRVPELYYSGRNGLLLQHPTADRARELLATIDRACPNWTDLTFVLTDPSPSLAALAAVAGTRLVPGPEIESPQFPLAATSDEFWKLCSKSTRQLARTARNKLTTLGELDVRAFSEPGQAQQLLETVLNIERHSWKHEAGTAITNRPEQEAFYRELFPLALQSGMLFAVILYVAGLPVAHNFGLLRDGVYCCLKHSHRKDLDKSSPAYFLTSKLIDLLIQRGTHHFDFMGRTEPHKLRWSPETVIYKRRDCVLYRDSVRARLLRRARNLRSKLHSMQQPQDVNTPTDSTRRED